jgi:hypothetical protein
MAARFPERRQDGTFTVLARLSVERPDAVRGVTERLRRIIEERTRGDTTLLLRDFSSLPRVESLSATTVDVTFDGLANSALWKDWVVALIRGLEDLPGVRFLAFRDLVSGREHPTWPAPDDVRGAE